MSLSLETLLFEVDDRGFAHLTINRPDKLNALNKKVFGELEKVVDYLKKYDSIHALMIKGAGDKAFVAGADIKELTELDSQAAERTSANGQAVFQSIEDLNIPVIGIIDGYALGGGLELALSCHMRIGNPNAVLGLPEVSLGLIPGWGGTQRLTAIVGKAKATELILTGNFVKADEALNLGLLNKVADNPEEEANALLGKIFKQGPLAVKMAIQAIRASGHPSGYKKESNLFGDLFSTADFKEGTSAFLEKRKAEFSGK